MTDKRRGTRHAAPTKRVQELLDAAETCFGEKGYIGTTIDHIAAQSGLSKGTVYRFFNSKDEILFALLDQYEEKIAERVVELLPEDAPYLEQIRVGQRSVIETLGSIPAMVSVWQEFQHHPDAKERIAEIFDAARENLETLTREAIANGEIREQPIDPVVTLLVTANEGILALANAQTGLDTLASFDATWPLIERAVS